MRARPFVMDVVVGVKVRGSLAWRKRRREALYMVRFTFLVLLWVFAQRCIFFSSRAFICTCSGGGGVHICINIYMCVLSLC